MDSEYLSAVDPDYPELERPIKAKEEESIDIGPKALGTGTNPMIHPLQGVEARLHDGAAKMEITFMGKGKGNSQSFTPESIDKTEREEIRNLMRINNSKLSVHATPNIMGVSGFTREGFDDRSRDESLKEIEKAIEFAAEASTGGAIVFHTGEWQRPISEQSYGESHGGDFTGFSTQKEKAMIMVADKDTGHVTAIKKDQFVYEPEFLDMQKFVKKQGFTQDSSGNYYDKDKKLVYKAISKDSQGNIKYRDINNGNGELYGDDWVDLNGEVIRFDPNNVDNTDRLFQRVPIWDDAGTNFKVAERSFKYFEKQAEKYKDRYHKEISPEELYFKSQIANKVLESKGGSLYHAKEYKEHEFRRNKIKETLDYWDKIDKNLSDDEKWRLMQDRGLYDLQQHGLEINKTKESKIDYLRRSLRREEDQMRYIHQSSASADARAEQAKKEIEKITTVEKYGLSRTAEALAKLGKKVWQKNQNKGYKGMDNLYLAPENFPTEMFGGHPEEMTKIVKASRERFVKDNEVSMGKENAKKAAEQVIKSTIDIGHLNQWRRHFIRKDDESDKSFNKRFDNWALKEVDKMHKANVLGHFHLADNFGYDDEHLTPGQGNAPIKEFVKRLRAKGYDDFIVEAGSFNPTNVLQDTWSYFGSPVSSSHPRGNFRDFRQAHVQYMSTPLYIAGAYAPSNQFKAWSEVPLH